jgi:hypothetical protein
MLFEITPEVQKENPYWREDLAGNANYRLMCATILTQCAIIDSQSKESSDPQRLAFNQSIIRNAHKFAALYARITASSIEDVETHYASRESFTQYTLNNWALFFEIGKEIVLG